MIINDILDFSKIEAGKLEIEESDLDVPGVVDDVGRILAEHGARPRGSSSSSTSSPTSRRALLGDGTRIRQVLLNFGANAVKFTSEGEVVIRVSVLHQNAERVALHFDVSRHGDRHRRGGSGAAVQRLRAGRLVDHPPVRRHRSRPGRSAGSWWSSWAAGSVSMSAPGEGSTFWFELSLRRGDDVRPTDGSGGSADALGPAGAGRRRQRDQPADPAPAAALVGRGGRRGGRRLRGARAGAHRSPGRPVVRPRRGRPQHARHGRDRAGAYAEGGSGHGADHALPAELVRPPPRGGRVAPHRLRGQPDQAGPLLGALRLPDHQPQFGVEHRAAPMPPATERAEPAPRSRARSCSSRTTR